MIRWRENRVHRVYSTSENVSVISRKPNFEFFFIVSCIVIALPRGGGGREDKENGVRFLIQGDGVVARCLPWRHDPFRGERCRLGWHGWWKALVAALFCPRILQNKSSNSFSTLQMEIDGKKSLQHGLNRRLDESSAPTCSLNREKLRHHPVSFKHQESLGQINQSINRPFEFYRSTLHTDSGKPWYIGL